MRRLVWDRLRPHLGDARRVLIVPDGALSLVPFAALPTGERSYLLETGPVIHYLSAERDLVSSPPSGAARHGLLAVGGPSFNDRTAFRGTGPTTMAFTFDPSGPVTRGTSTECGEPAVREVPAAHRHPAGGPQSLRTVGPLRRVGGRDGRGSCARRSWRHRKPRSSARPADTVCCISRRTASSWTTRVRPRLRARAASAALPGSGPARSTIRCCCRVSPWPAPTSRALAGPDEDEGILTAEEVASLDLGGVDWAVLSACDTGVGEIKAGEGVFGLRRAFQVAGARTVVMSLWSVEDQATRAWMRALYEGRFQRKLSTADAVHQASLAVLRNRRARGQSTHPFYWAAFVAAGDWR